MAHLFPILSLREVTPIWDPGMIVCLSLSKFGMPGVRTGIVVADDIIIRAVTNANAILSLSPGSFGPVLITEAMQFWRASKNIHRSDSPALSTSPRPSSGLDSGSTRRLPLPHTYTGRGNIPMAMVSRSTHHQW